MANWYFPLLLISLATAVTFAVLLRKRRRRAKNNGALLPPGPPWLPVVGNLHQLTGGVPHHVITKLSEKYGAVMRLQLGEWVAVVVSSPAAAKELLATKELCFPQRPRLPSYETVSYDHSGLVLAPFGDYWRRVRKMCASELLSAARVNSFRRVREEEIGDLVAAIGASGAAVNLSEMIFMSTGNVTSRAAFGVRCEDGGKFMTLLLRLLEVAAGFDLADLYPSWKFLRHVTGMQAKLDRIHVGLDRILEEMVNRAGQRVDHGEDLLDVLIKLQGSGEADAKLTNNQIKAITLDIFAAGSEASATTMEWAMAELMNHPIAMEKAQTELRKAFKGSSIIKETDLQRQNLPYLRAVVKETLRLHPPVPLSPRECTEACEVGGYRIPPRAKVFINLYAIGRDPNTWAEPHCFRPERFVGSTVDFIGSNFELIPFGGGRRICPGISFASANIELALARMLYHFDWSLPRELEEGGDKVDMSESYCLTSRKKDSLYLVPTLSIPFSTG